MSSGFTLASAKDFLVSLTAPDFNKLTLRQILLWERPQATAIIVGCISLIVLAFGVLGYSAVTFACRLLQLAMVIIGGLSYQKVLQCTTRDISNTARRAISDAEVYIIAVIETLFKIVTWEEPLVSLYVFIGSLAVALLGNLFTDITLLAIAAVALFGAPILYTKNKSTIDPQVKRASQLLGEYVKSIKPKTA